MKKKMNIKKFVEEERAFTGEFVEPKMVKERLEFKFDFRKFEPFKEMGEVYWLKTTRKEMGEARWEKMFGRSDNIFDYATSCELIMYRKSQGMEGPRTPFEQNYIKMVDAVRVYYGDAIVRAHFLGQLQGQNDVLNSLHQWLTKKQLTEIGAVLNEEADLIKAYINACTTYKTEKPDLAQLADISGASPTTWSRKLKMPHFLFALRAALEKKRNLAKEPTHEFWIKAFEAVGLMLEHVAQDIQQKRRRDRRPPEKFSEDDVET